MSSPYPWHYTLRWPYYFLRPSLKRHSQLERRPLSYSFERVQAKDTIRLMFFGDMMPVKGGRIPRIDPAIRDLLSEADLVIGNCEAPITQKTRSLVIIFQMAKNFVQAFLADLGLNPANCILSVANNHIGDQGEAGLATTIEHLRRMGITPIGEHRPDQSPVKRISYNGLSLGIVAWTHWLNRNVFRATSGVWRAHEIETLPWQAIKRSEAVDLLIGTPHWGYEFQHFPSAETRIFAQRLLAQGFGLLVGHHPHVLQPIEWLKRKLCAYSLGNLNGPPALPYVRWPVRLGFIFEVQLISSGRHVGKIARYTFHPCVSEVKEGDVWLVSLEKVAPELREKMGIRVRQLFRIPDEIP